MSLFNRRLAACLLAVAGVMQSVAVASTGVRVVREAGTDPRTESLVLTFAGGAPRLTVDAVAGGLDLWLPGASLADPIAAGIRVDRQSDGTRLHLDGPGTVIQSMKYEGADVRIRIARPASDETRAGSDYRIGVGDIVTITVYKNPDLSGEFPVAHDGTINLPLTGPVAANGLTDAELSARLVSVLDKDFLIDPQVSVSVKTYQSQWIYVTGAVTRANRVPLAPGLALKDALSEAGVALGPGQQVVLTRAAGAGETVTLDAEAIDRPDALSPRDGDVLTVLEPLSIFIQGEVRRPGRLPLLPGMSVLQAISLSEGLTEWANKKEVRILRSIGQEMMEETVNLKKVEERKAPDPLLKAGDVILVRRRVL